MNIASDPKSIENTVLSPEANQAAALAHATGVLTVDLDALVANWRKLEKTAVPAECAGVIKADAYGCGAEPVARALAIKPYPDFEFPQMTSPELAPPSWEPMFADYFYLSFTNATAFSPTDVMPMTRWAKAAMTLQTMVSIVVVALVVSRAVNILK